jgi:hypothetical protein
MRQRPLLTMVLLLHGACGGDEPRRASDAPATFSPAATAHQDTGFVGTTAVTHRARPGAPPAMLGAVAAASQPGYDRVVFQFAGDSVPGYHVWVFPAGWQRVVLLRRDVSGSVVVADAVRARQ